MKRIRKVLVLLLVLAYTGQGLAAGALSCPKMAHGSTAVDMADMAAMAHAGHQMTVDTDTAPASCGYCEGGLCATSHCQSAAALPPEHLGSSRQYAVLYPRAVNTDFEFHPVDSLYRPPISR